MRAMFGVVFLLVALAVVGLVATRQLRAVGQLSAPASSGSGTGSGIGSGPDSVREQSGRLQHQIANDTIKAMDAAATARDEDTAK